MHTTRSSFPRLFLLLAALSLCPLYEKGTSAQRTGTSPGSQAGLHPRSIEAVALPHPLEFSRRYTVWLDVPRDAAAPVDIELRAESRPAMLEIGISPPLCAAVAPGQQARFTVTLRGRPAFAGGSFTLAFREPRAGLVLGAIPVEIERGAASPRSAKEAALETLTELRAEVQGGRFEVGEREAAVSKLEHAIKELGESLAPTLWRHDDFGNLDPERLDPHEGREVFHEERESAQKIFDAIRQGEISDSVLRDELVAIIDSLVSADRRLAEVAIQDALEAGGAPGEIEEAMEHLAEGDQLVSAAAEESDLLHVAALLYTAMDGAYRHAWVEAIESH